MRDRVSGSMVEQVILFLPLLENHDMTSWQKKGEMCGEPGWACCSGPPGDRIRHKNWAEIPPSTKLCLQSTFAHFSVFWGVFSNIWTLLCCTQERPFPLLCAPSPSPSAVPHAGPVAVTRENNLSDCPQSIILWHWALSPIMSWAIPESICLPKETGLPKIFPGLPQPHWPF